MVLWDVKWAIMYPFCHIWYQQKGNFMGITVRLFFAIIWYSNLMLERWRARGTKWRLKCYAWIILTIWRRGDLNLALSNVSTKFHGIWRSFRGSNTGCRFAPLTRHKTYMRKMNVLSLEARTKWLYLKNNSSTV